jgi:3-oxoacyl-[acyl-carrier-protein] synthase-3
MSNVEITTRALFKIWGDFSSQLDAVPLIDKLNRGKFRLEDYRRLLLNHRQQVVQGSRWIARAASSIDSDYLDLRSTFLRHAITEHRDYRMLEDHYVSIGGNKDDILTQPSNIGSEALHAFMFHRASQPNPFDLIGGMFIIEGLGREKAGDWGRAIQSQLGLDKSQVEFFLYHAENDDDHMQELNDTLESGILDIPGMPDAVIKTAKIVARLYRLQLEEMDHV